MQEASKEFMMGRERHVEAGGCSNDHLRIGGDWLLQKPGT